MVSGFLLVFIWRLPKDKYQHAFYRNELQKHGIIQSMSRKGNGYDNCIMETFFGRLKNEMFYGFEKDYPSFEFRSCLFRSDASANDISNRCLQKSTLPVLLR